MPQHWYNDSGTWRQTNALWYNDAGTWREMAEAWYNDGGTWRRVHRRELRRPTGDSVTSGSFTTRTNPSYAYDADDSTHILTEAIFGNVGAFVLGKTAVNTFTPWQTTANTYNTLQLYVAMDAEGSSGINSVGGYLTSSVKLEAYVTVSGVRQWTEIYKYTTPVNSTSGPTVTGKLSYALAQSDLVDLQVRVTVQAASAGGLSGDTPGDATATITDIFTVGTY